MLPWACTSAARSSSLTGAAENAMRNKNVVRVVQSHAVSSGSKSQLDRTCRRMLSRQRKISRQLLQAYAAEAYRTEKLTRYQVGQLLGLDRWQTEDFTRGH